MKKIEKNIICLLLAGFLTIHTNAQNEFIKILPLGNSITAGYNRTTNELTNNSYRKELKEKLGDKYIFVGSQSHLVSQHEGHPGWTSYQILHGYFKNDRNWDDMYEDERKSWFPEYSGSKPISKLLSSDIEFQNRFKWYADGRLSTWIEDYEYDYVLLQIGSNDVSVAIINKSVDKLVEAETGSKANIKRIIKKLIDKNPNVIIFLAKIIPRDDHDGETDIEYTEYLNQKIAEIPGEIRDEYPNRNYRIILVDQFSPFLNNTGSINSSLFQYDNLHPNETGDKVMANTWYKAMKGARAMYFNDGFGNYITELIHPIVFTDKRQLSYNWNNSPNIKVDALEDGDNNFSVRYEGTIEVDATDDYNFQVITGTNEQFRFWLKDKYIEQWDGGIVDNTDYKTGYLSLKRGTVGIDGQPIKYPFRLEHKHRGSYDYSPTLYLKWEKKNDNVEHWEIVPGNVIGPPQTEPGRGLQGSYYNDPEDVNFENATADVVRTDQQINFNWDKYDPDSRMDNDGTFAVVWEGKIRLLYTGDYYLFTRFNSAIESVKVWFDGSLLTPNQDQRYYLRNQDPDASFTHLYNIKIEYLKFSNELPSSNVVLEWESADNGPQDLELVPSYCLYLPDDAKPTTSRIPQKGLLSTYYNLKSDYINEDYWDGWPDSFAYPKLNCDNSLKSEMLDQGVEQNINILNFNWWAGSPDYRIGTDYFVAKSIGFFILPNDEAAGEYEFEWDTNIGGLLTLGERIDKDNTIVDTWTNKNSQITGTKVLEHGKKYMITASQFDRRGNASHAVLKWRPVNRLKGSAGDDFEIVPPDAFVTPGDMNPFLQGLMIMEHGIAIKRFENGEAFTIAELLDGFDLMASVFPENPPRVVFELDGSPVHIAYSPYLLIGDGDEIGSWPPSPGTHRLTVIPYTSSNEPGVGVTFDFEVVTETIVRDEKELQKWNLYPNPADDKIFITRSDNSFRKAKILICTIDGKTIYKTEASKQNIIEINTGTFSPGLYIINIITDEYRENSPLIIK